jgi:hypothetical protein
MIAVDFARFRKLPDDAPAFGIIHEALALCRGRDPENFQRQLEPSILQKNWWFAHRGSGTQKERMRLPADCIEMVLDRKTFADFVEPMELEDPSVVARRVYDRFFGKDPIPFPTYREIERDVKHALTTLRCISCGAKDHISTCPKVQNPSCEYEHDGEIGLRAHTTEFCPVLHNYCGECQTVGHHERVHYTEGLMKTGRELRQRYFQFMARGAYTSIPYLVFHPEGYKKLSGAHWRRSYDGRAYRHAVITRHVLGIGPEIQEKLAELIKHLPESKTCDADREWQLEAIRANIQKAETGETIPLPRDLLMDMQAERRERELLMRQAKYDADREERLTGARQRATSPISERTSEKQERKQSGKSRKKPRH